MFIDMVSIKPRMCNCSQCRRYRTSIYHEVRQYFRTFQRKVFNRKLRRYLKSHSKIGDYELPNYGNFIKRYTD